MASVFRMLASVVQWTNFDLSTSALNKPTPFTSLMKPLTPPSHCRFFSPYRPNNLLAVDLGVLTHIFGLVNLCFPIKPC